MERSDPTVSDSETPRLSDWLKQHPHHHSLGWMHGLIGSLSTALDALHREGRGYFRLMPEQILVVEGSETPAFRLLSPEASIPVAGKELISIPVNPHYAPPEAAGLTRHSPGEGLLAWDWWSLGRVVQELLLGKPLICHLLKKDLGRDTQEAIDKAEGLLLGRLEGTLHPGAMEKMPPGNPRFELLLKGLLSASPSARWTRHQIEAWLGGASPREHYNMSRHERLFRLLGHNCTVAEAAEILSTEAHWGEARHHLLDSENPGTLAAFLQAEAGQAAALQRLEEVTDLLQDESYLSLPKASVEEAIIILGLQQLTGGKLVWRGHRVDTNSLRELLQRDTGEGLMLGTVAALAAAPSIALMDHFDTETARILSDTHKWVEKIAARATSLGWMSRGDNTGLTRLWILALETPAHLHQIIEQMRATFAASTRPEAEHLFRISQPAMDEAILLAWLAPVAARFGFVTHEEWAVRRLAELRSQGREVVLALYWRYLQRALQSGPWWFGHMLWLIVGWGAAVVAVAVAQPGPIMLGVAMLPVLLALGIRLGMSARIGHHLRQLTGDASIRWHFSDGPGRCRREREKGDLVLRTPEELRRMLVGLNRSIAELKAIQPPPAPVAPPPRLRLVWWSSVASWALLMLIFGLCFREIRIHPPSWARFREAWSFGESQREDTEAEAVAGKAKAKLVLQPWPFKTPEEARPLVPKETREATKDQMQEALARGNRLTENYARPTIDALVAVQVGAGDAIAFMLYDGKRKQVANKMVFILPFLPFHRTWVDLGGKKIIVLAD